MAFDMYCCGERAFIGHHEEGLFRLVDEDDQFPQLSSIWRDFYKSPRILPDAANAIVHELILLRTLITDEKPLLHAIDRLLPFFSRAYKTRTTIECASD